MDAPLNIKQFGATDEQKLKALFQKMDEDLSDSLDYKEYQELKKAEEKLAAETAGQIAD